MSKENFPIGLAAIIFGALILIKTNEIFGAAILIAIGIILIIFYKDEDKLEERKDLIIKGSKKNK